MNHWHDEDLPLLMSVALFVIALAGAAMAQNATLYKSEQGIPEVVSIRATMSDRARICVEPPGGGLVTCKSIGELRKWVMDTRPK